MDSEGVKKYFLLNEDLLECPVCLETIDSTPIHQCRNGHVVCKDCRPKLRICPTCLNAPISQRNRKMEEIVESVMQNEIKTMDCRQDTAGVPFDTGVNVVEGILFIYLFIGTLWVVFLL